MRILITGIAGFIGSTTAERLLGDGHVVVGLDNLSTGHLDNVPNDLEFIEGDCADGDLIKSLGRFDACVHFAASIEAGESMDQPERYFANNVAASIRLFESLIETGTNRIVYSSTAAVYGNPVAVPIHEDALVRPLSPYGASKSLVEQSLEWLVARHRIRSAVLRYFNAAGGTARHPERHNPETHLIPIALEVALGLREQFTLYGDDYDTPDGTCIRDYVHVTDLADAHVRAIGALQDHESFTVNLGTGVGSSNRRVIDVVRAITGRDIDVRIGARRAGDPAVAVASSEQARDLLGWQPLHSTVDEIISDAWRFHPLRS